MGFENFQPFSAQCGGFSVAALKTSDHGNAISIEHPQKSLLRVGNIGYFNQCQGLIKTGLSRDKIPRLLITGIKHRPQIVERCMQYGIDKALQFGRNFVSKIKALLDSSQPCARMHALVGGPPLQHVTLGNVGCGILDEIVTVNQSISIQAEIAVESCGKESPMGDSIRKFSLICQADQTRNIYSN